MIEETIPERDKILNAYSRGLRGTRETIEELALNDYGDLLVALTLLDLRLPKPQATATHAAHLARATSVLQPRLINDQ